jgi:hypothetical protein
LLFPRRAGKGCFSRQVLFKHGFVRRPRLKFFIFIEWSVLNLLIFSGRDKFGFLISDRRAKFALLRGKSVKIFLLLSPAMTDRTEEDQP